MLLAHKFKKDKKIGEIPIDCLSLRTSNIVIGKSEDNFGTVEQWDSRRWKGGRTKDTAGYILNYIEPTDPYYSMRNRKTYILEHRLIIAKHLGRCLESWEVVHHKNHIRDDNRIKNLELCKVSEHQAITVLETENRRLREEIEKLKEQVK